MGRPAARLRGRSPFPVLVILAGLITGVIGTLIGLPALRLSGLYLALITLMAAGAITVVLRIAQFPNGGDGFFGNSAAGGASSRLPRPALATGDTAYYRYCVVVAALMFLLAVWHVQRQAGTGVGGDPPEPGDRRRRRGQHDLLQAVGVRPGVVHRRGRRSDAGVGDWWGEHQPVPGAELDHPARRRPDGRRLQHLGGGRGSVAVTPPAGAARRLGRVDRAADDPVRDRRPTGADDGARRPGRPGAEGSRQARSAHPRVDVWRRPS